MEDIIFHNPDVISDDQRLSAIMTMPPVSCYFFSLPSELKLEVIDYLDQKRDLYNVSRSCRWLEDVVLRRLYNTIDMEIPMQHSPTWAAGRYLMPRAHVIKAVRELTIRERSPEHEELCHPRGSLEVAESPEKHVAEIVAKIPTNQLRSFSLLHRQPVTPRMLQLLNHRNTISLRHFSCYELERSELPPSAFPSNLESIECRTIGDGETLGKLVLANQGTLQTLRIGEERALVEQYIIEKNAFQRPCPQPLIDFKKCVNIADLQRLRHLSLIGLDLGPLFPQNIDEALYLTRLQELTIESCAGTPTFLLALASTFTLAQTEAAPEPRSCPSLEKFLFRQEVFTSMLKDALMQFLNSFSGLHTLSLLFENSSVNVKPADLIVNHGSTMEKLVIESRIQPRHNLRHDTSRPFGSGAYSSQAWVGSMNDICQTCPNMTELSIGFPWNDEMIRIRPVQFHTLASLKTMHVRNFPESSQLSQMGDYTVKEHAIKFIEWTYGNVTGERPQLETLSIGPAIYESRFKGCNPGRQRVPEFLRPHHFTVDWAQTRFGRWSAMITQVSEKYMEETRCEKPLAGVFEQVWLK